MPFILPLSLWIILISAGFQLIIWLNWQHWAWDTNQKTSEVEIEAEQCCALLLLMICEFSNTYAVQFSDVTIHCRHIDLLYKNYSFKYIFTINYYALQNPWPCNLAYCFPSPPTPWHCFYTRVQHMHPIKPCFASFSPSTPTSRLGVRFRQGSEKVLWQKQLDLNSDPELANQRGTDDKKNSRN